MTIKIQMEDLKSRAVTVGPLGESEGPSIGKGGKSDVESRHLQGSIPRLCRLRTDGLSPMSMY
jgi:hypothetical protein